MFFKGFRCFLLVLTKGGMEKNYEKIQIFCSLLSYFVVYLGYYNRYSGGSVSL